MKKTLATLVTVLLATVLSGCVRMHINITLQENDTASGDIVLAVSDESAKELGMSPTELFDAMLSSAGDVDDIAPDEATSEPYAQDGYTGTRWTFKEQPLSETEGSGLTIARDGDDFVVSGDMSGEETAVDEAPEEMLNQIDTAFSVTFPGEVKEANGEINGKTVTWTMTPGKDMTISARGSAKSSGASSSNLGLILGIAAGVIVLGGIIAAIVLSRGKKNRGDINYQVPPPYVTQVEAQTAQPQTGYSQPQGNATPTQPPAPVVNTEQPAPPAPAQPGVVPSEDAPAELSANTPHSQTYPLPPADLEDPENPQQ